MSDFKFPSDTCVLACSGPSLNLVDPFELGVPVVAISTAIRVINHPHYWILADYLNEMHGEEGMIAYQNENITKIIPQTKISGKHSSIIKNYMEIPYCDSDRRITNRDAYVFSGQLPLLKGPHKTVTFAVQWLHHVGVKKIIWVGNDMQAKSPQEKYAYQSNEVDLRKSHNYTATIDQVFQYLTSWYPIALSRGFEWYSWKCGERFETLVPPFDYDNYQKPDTSNFFNPTLNSQYPIEEVPFQKVVPKKIRKIDKIKLQEFREQQRIKEEELFKKKLTEEENRPPRKIYPTSPPVDPTKYRYTSLRTGAISNKRLKDYLR